MNALHLFFKVIMLHNYKMISVVFFMKRLFFEWKHGVPYFEKQQTNKNTKLYFAAFLF